MKLLLYLLSAILLHATFIESLLEQYKIASDLSHVTKKDTAGFVDIYTREDIENMQAYTLKDLLKTLSLVHYTYAPNGLNLFTNISSGYIPPNFVRIYINDHDLSSSSFGSALLIWGEMPIEFIDHVEIYKGTSSIEFGNETGVMIIKLYTKKAQREEGKKVRFVVDTLKSVGADAYVAHTFDEDHSLFFYIHRGDIKSKKYENDGYKLKRGYRDINFYAEYDHKDLGIEIGSFFLDKDPFLGNGRLYHSIGGGLDARHTFIKIEKQINGVDIDFSYDYLNYDRVYEDPSGVYTSRGYVQRYNLKFKDDIFSIEAKKSYKLESGSLFLGGYYKYKGFKANGVFDKNVTSYSNVLHLFSLYGEYIYKFDEKSMGIVSAKGELYRYKRKVKDQDVLTLRVGYIRSLNDHWKVKGFLTRSSIAPQFYQQYSNERFPLLTNAQLDMNKITLALFGLTYRNKDLSFEIRSGKRWIKNRVYYSPLEGYLNDKRTSTFEQIDIELQKKFSEKNRLYVTLTKAKSSQGKFSPDIQCNVRLFNRVDKFDIYNELLFKNGYDYYGLHLDSSYDYTLAVKYHFTPDFSIGVRGENLFNKGFKQAYRKITRAYPVYDRKIMFNLEYMF